MRLKEFKANLNPKFVKHGFSVHKDVLNKLLVGNYVSTYKNKGIEFLDYREYTKADDASRIDWKATLKANKLLIRQTIEEKAVNVLFLVDVSDTMLFSSGDKLKCEYAAEIVAGLGFAIQREGNAIGLCMFSDKIVKNLTPKIGAEQYYDILKEISNPKNYGGKANLNVALKHAISLMNIPALLIIISDFIELEAGWERYLKIISVRYELLGINIRDPLDRKIPKHIGYLIIEDPSSNKKMVIDTNEYFDKYNNMTLHDELVVEANFKKAKSSCLVLETDKDYFNPLIRFLEKRSKIK